MINNGSGRGFEKIRERLALAATCSVMLASSLIAAMPAVCAQEQALQTAEKTDKKAEPKSDKKADKENKDKDKDKDKADKKAESKTDGKKAEEKKPEVIVENVQNVTTEQLVDRPHEYLNKNIKFDAPFHAFSSLALDYKPAMRSSKTYLSFLVLRPNSHVPYSELKLAMAIPKEKDPDNTLLAGLKEGDTVEVTGHVFAAALDEPWVDVLKLKKIASAPDKEKKDEDKKASETEPESKKKD